MAGVNVEALLVAWLKADATVDALVDGRVSTELPSDPDYPLVTLKGVSSAEAVRRRVDDHRVQVDCWADTRPAAASLARTVRGAMESLEGVLVDLGFVSEVRTEIGPRWLPDVVPGVPKPVYSADYAVVVHP